MEIIDITWNCPSCGLLNSFSVGNLTPGNRPSVNWDIAACEEFKCSECDATYYTGDFEMLSEDEI